VILKLTAAGKRVLDEAPYLLRSHFLQELEKMAAPEQAALLNTLERTASLMEADSPGEIVENDAQRENDDDAS
jgi:hypothetical protein